MSACAVCSKACKAAVFDILCAGTLESMFLIKQVMSWTFHTKEIDNSNAGRHKTICMIRGGKRVKMT